MQFRVLSHVIPPALALTILAAGLPAAPIGGYSQTNLVSDISGLALNTDANLKNPWGISFSGSSPFWVSDNATGLSTLYNTAGTPLALVVTIPGGAPTGTVFNGGSTAFNSDLFLFATEGGTIAGWRGVLGTTAETVFTSPGAVFKGLAISSIGSDRYLYAADFHNAVITVFKSTGAPDLAGSFTDPTLPAGYAPFNIQNLGGQLYVAYAKQETGSDEEEPGAGFGFVSVFNPDGTFIRRAASGGVLNAPWGLALAPVGWGAAGGTLLIGNFGDGTINAFDTSGSLVGTLADIQGTPIANEGLWGLAFGNGGNGGHQNTLYLTAGLNDEVNGLFAQIDAAVPEPGTLSLLATGIALLGVFRRRAVRS